MKTVNTRTILFAFILMLGIFLLPTFCQAQIEKVIVETYYVSDANDATDTLGGYLEPGSKTYRVYIDLLPGYKLNKIYGDANHTLKISSTLPFFNNKGDGQTFGKDFSKNRYGDNTVALDTWLTLGQLTKTSTKTFFGVLKQNDSNGSFVGGVNNDGGSATIATGLLTNNDASAITPLTVADGNDTMSVIPSNWAHFGIISTSGDDSTIFGSIVSATEFISANCALQNSGVGGVVPDSNQILIAQLTTKGEISFELNLEVADSNGNIIKYVANADTLLENELVSPLLKYPPACGCNNPDFLEYSSNFACGISDSCRTLIVFGCMDPLACNYNSKANFSVPELCCYPGACEPFDINILCPNVSVNEIEEELSFIIYPNPATDNLKLNIGTANQETIRYSITDILGREVSTGTIFKNSIDSNIEIKNLDQGVYSIHLFSKHRSGAKLFFKQ